MTGTNKIFAMSIVCSIALLASCGDTFDKMKDLMGDVNTSTRHLALSINQLGVYIDEYHDEDPKKREKARRIIRAIFPDGIPDSPEGKLSVSLTVAATGLSPDQTLDMGLVYSMDKPIDVRKLEAVLSNNYGWSPKTFSSFDHENIAMESDIRETIRSQFAAFEDKHSLDVQVNSFCVQKTGQGFDFNAPPSSPLSTCVKEKRFELRSKMIEDAILAVRGKNAKVPARSTHSWPYNEGRFAIFLIKDSELSNHPNLALEVVHHITGDTNARMNGFKEQSFKVDVEKMRRIKNVISLKGEDETLHWFAVPLRLSEEVYEL